LINYKKLLLYFTEFSKSFALTDLHKMWHSNSRDDLTVAKFLTVVREI